MLVLGGEWSRREGKEIARGVYFLAKRLLDSADFKKLRKSAKFAKSASYKKNAEKISAFSIFFQRIASLFYSYKNGLK